MNQQRRKSGSGQVDVRATFFDDQRDPSRARWALAGRPTPVSCTRTALFNGELWADKKAQAVLAELSESARNIIYINMQLLVAFASQKEHRPYNT